MKSPRRLVLALAAAGVLTAACIGSEPIDRNRDSGAPPTSGEGGSGSGIAGETGAAGTGASSSGAAGKTGAAGSAGGSAGTNGSGTGSAGTNGSGSGAAGTGSTTGTGAAGTSGGKVDGGAGSSGGSDAAPALGYVSSFIGNMLVNNCGGCHYAAPGVNVQGGFAFSYDSILGAVTAAHASCPLLDASKRRAVPGKPENSLIYIKASMDNPPSACGGHMPFQGSSLSAANLALLHDWIAQGAKP